MNMIRNIPHEQILLLAHFEKEAVVAVLQLSDLSEPRIIMYTIIESRQGAKGVPRGWFR